MQGLVKLDPAQKVGPRTGDSKDHYQPGQILGNYLYLGDKPGGVEPGFLGIEIDKKLIDRICAQFPHSFKMAENGNFAEAWNDLKSKNTTVLDFIRQLKDEGMGKTPAPAPEDSEPLTLWLIKQDYVDPKDPENPKVAPPEYRLKKTNAIKSLPAIGQTPAVKVYKHARQSAPSEENRNAILECLANDIARASGMPVQTQHLVFGSYTSGHLKIMTACRWEPGLKMIEGSLHGSAEKKAYENYLVKMDDEEPALAQDGKMQADDRIQNLGENLALFIQQGDRDVLGSKGQNKGRVENSLFGFDFGHAYREDNPLLGTLTDDFSFEQPSDTNKKFKNMSVFFDSPLSERMMGMYYLYQMLDQTEQGQYFTADEQANIAHAIESYKDKNQLFKNRIETIVPGAFTEVFSKYGEKFKELATAENFSDAEGKELFDHFLAIRKAHELSKAANEQMFTVFKKRMQMEYKEIELLDNLEKLSSVTSEYSTDHKVKLQHLRVRPKMRRAWDLERHVSEAGVTTYQLKPRSEFATEDLSVLSCFITLANKNRELPIEFKMADAAPEAEGFEVIRNGISFDEDNFTALCKLLTEDEVRKYKNGGTEELGANPIMALTRKREEMFNLQEQIKEKSELIEEKRTEIAQFNKIRPRDFAFGLAKRLGLGAGVALLAMVIATMVLTGGIAAIITLPAAALSVAAATGSGAFVLSTIRGIVRKLTGARKLRKEVQTLQAQTAELDVKTSTLGAEISELVRDIQYSSRESATKAKPTFARAVTAPAQAPKPAGRARANSLPPRSSRNDNGDANNGGRLRSSSQSGPSKRMG